MINCKLKLKEPCMCSECAANDGKHCTIRHEPTCAACSSKQYENITYCTDFKTEARA